MLDTIGLFLAGAAESSLAILINDALDQGGRPDALVIGAGDRKCRPPWPRVCSAPPATRMTGTTRRCRTIPRMSTGCSRILPCRR